MANQNIDVLYQRSREELLQFEDARLNSLLQSVANFYTTRNDQSTWGNFLRALAKELARIDYSYSYDIVNKDPNFLTPPDASRRWRDPLYVASNWPSKTQFDTDFKFMLVGLIAAYRQGSTVKAIQDVIFAYTGINIVVEELYKQIGNGVFDQSDRNAIKVSVSVGNNSLSQITSLTQLQQIVQSLAVAIDLAKPAHVGLEFTTVFGEGDDIDCFISPRFVTAAQFLTLTPDQQALYTLTAFVLVGPPIFWQASTPTSTPFTASTLLRDSNGNLQLALTAGKPGVFPPGFGIVSGGMTVDGEINWKNISPQPSAISLSTNIVTVMVPNIFTLGQQVVLINLAGSFAFLNGQKLSVLTSDGASFTAAFAHVDVPPEAQAAGTVTFFPNAQINLISYQALSADFKLLYQQQYTNTNCTSTGIEDTLRILIRQVEQPPFDPMLIQAPVLDPSNPQTAVAGYGRRLSPALSAAQYAALPSITFRVVNTVSDGVNLGYTFDSLSAPGTLPLHEGERVSVQNCRLPFNITGKIRDVVMLTPTGGTFQIALPSAGSPIGSAAEAGNGTVTPTLQSAYTLQGNTYVLLQQPPAQGLPPALDTEPQQLNPANKWVSLSNVDNVGNTYLTGEVSNWDIAHPIGLVAPRLDQAWEIGGGDQDFLFELT